MEEENIFFIEENQVNPEQEEFLKNYFIENVSPGLVTVILSEDQKQDLSDNKGFLIITMDLDQKILNQIDYTPLLKSQKRLNDLLFSQEQRMTNNT